MPDPYATWTPLLPENIPNPLAKPIREELVEESLKTDLVVVATGLKADHSLFEACQAQNAAGEIFSIGDNFRIGHVFEAVHAGSISAGRCSHGLSKVGWARRKIIAYDSAKSITAA